MSHNQSLARRAKKGSKNQIRLPPILKGKKAGDPLALISPVTEHASGEGTGQHEHGIERLQSHLQAMRRTAGRRCP